MSARREPPAIDPGRLSVAIRASWSAETSVDPAAWSPSCPALGQCAVTALIVQDYLGGMLMRAMVGDVSHYWNWLPDGAELDLTREQFTNFVPRGTTESARSYVLSFSSTFARYQRLRSAVEGRLAQLERRDQQ